ncbi:TonB-dependent receptor plug domain-containing protein [Roseateles oligotrophus]|uniref:TonB-dependent receptor n=1 Tax=Roseateles oligotrophus TaxID=1769250 RepID=A0ABT2YLJ0_9BURK|nr:TonB-dependent receptor [Roseateles oligotrophus]MCV2370927.1 TonB-dependent receptor [Roseateles oligotrophus]
MRSTTVLCMALACIGHVYAQENPLDLTSLPFEKLTQTDVITASKLAKQVSDSPSAVSIVTAADIRTFGYRTLADVINSMRGLYTTFDRRYEYLGGRGFGAPGDYVGRIMVLIDGNATQDNLYNQAYIDNSGLIDLELIDRVEYVPGTGSVTYGNNALLGIINVITKKGSDFNSAQLAGDVFSHGGHKQRISIGKKLDNGVDVLFSASWLKSDGQDLYFPYFDTPAQNNGRAVNQDFEENRRLFGKLELNGLSLQAASVTRTKASPLPKRENAFNRIYQLVDETNHASAKYDFNINKDLKSVSRLYYGHYEDKTLREYGEINPAEQFRKNMNVGKWWGLDQKFALTRFDGHLIVFGAEYRDDFKQEFSPAALNSKFEEQSRYHKYPYTNKTYSLYGTDEFIVSDKVTANVGIRFDKPNAIDCSVEPCIRYARKAAISPRLALTYQAEPETTVKVAYSQAFRLPNPYDISSSQQSDTFKPEQVTATELILLHDVSPTLRLTGSIYRNILADQHYLSSSTGADVFTGSSKTHGIELQIDQTWPGDMQLRASAAWQNANDSEGRRLVNSPRSLAKVNFSLPALDSAIRVGVEAQYQGSRITKELRNDADVVIRPGRPLGGITLFNLTLTSAQRWNGIGASFSIKNALNRQFELPTSITRHELDGLVLDAMQMDGRTYWLQLSWDFWR